MDDKKLTTILEKNKTTLKDKWGITQSILEKNKETTLETLRKHLEIAAEKLPQSTHRITLDTFDADDSNLQIFPRLQNWQWSSCEDMMRLFNTKSVMMYLSNLWQIEPILYKSCRSVGAPILVIQPENLPVGSVAIEKTGIDTIISEASDAAKLSIYLLEKNIPLPNLWILIHKYNTRSWDIPITLRNPDVHVAQEVHLFPGVVILQQCKELAGKKDPVFHMSDAYYFEIEETHTCITSVNDDPFPLTRLKVPITLSVEGECSCGKELIKQT